MSGVQSWAAASGTYLRVERRDSVFEQRLPVVQVDRDGHVRKDGLGLADGQTKRVGHDLRVDTCLHSVRDCQKSRTASLEMHTFVEQALRSRQQRPRDDHDRRGAIPRLNVL